MVLALSIPDFPSPRRRLAGRRKLAHALFRPGPLGGSQRERPATSRVARRHFEAAGVRARFAQRSKTLRSLSGCLRRPSGENRCARRITANLAMVAGRAPADGSRAGERMRGVRCARVRRIWRKSTEEDQTD
jgi:hypothetical protein